MLDRKTKKIMTLYGALHPKSYVDRLYLARQKRGRGRLSCEMCVKAYKNNLWYVRNSNEILMAGVRTIRILEIEGAKEKNEFKRDRQKASLNRFIITFQYNSRALTGLSSVLYESTEHGTNESSRHHPQKWRISVRIFLRELLNLEDYFLYDLGIEEGNELFTAVDFENVNVSDKVD